jgi:membrane protease YdiL (CAAX protease family)
MWPGFIIEGTSGEDRLQTHSANIISVESGSSRNRLIAALLSFCAILFSFWFAGRHFSIEQRIGGHLPSTFAAFALLLAPYWFFGFGLARVLESIRNRAIRVLLPGVLVIPYLIFSLPRGEFRWSYGLLLPGITVGLACLFELIGPKTAAIAWQDVIALCLVGFPVEFRLLPGAFPHSGLSAFSKFLLLDAALYAYLVVRRLDGVGYNFSPRLRDFAIGLRNWALYACIALPLGFLLHFISFYRRVPSIGTLASALLVTFFFVAIPEELFFRGLLQNMLEVRYGARRALIIASIVFGLSHFNKPLPFNWRYVAMATVAGIFYGLAWRDRRRLLSSATTHTLVDVVWSLWFR